MSAYYGSGSSLALDNLGASSGGGGVYDVIGVGFGASALGTAIAIAEHNDSVVSPMSQKHKDDPVRKPKTFTALGGLQSSLAGAGTNQQEQDRHHPAGAPEGLDDLTNMEDISEDSEIMQRKLTCCFLDKNPNGFQWHAGMMLEGSRMQISFLKDLVTMRNPMSPYSFLAYLHSHSQSRLASFISLSTFTPTRAEFGDYLRWAARRVKAELEQDDSAVIFGERVVAIQAVLLDSYATGEREDVRLVRVTTVNVNTGATSIRFARNVLVSTGGSPNVPSSLANYEYTSTKEAYVIHSADYLYTVPGVLQKILRETPTIQGSLFEAPKVNQGLTSNSSAVPVHPKLNRGGSKIDVRLGDDNAEGRDPSKPKHIRVAVIGGGQSAAEVFLNMYRSIAGLMQEKDFTAEIEMFFRGTSLRPADSTAFSNEVFDPGMVKATYNLDHEHRAKLLGSIRDTNYSVVSEATLSELYEALYDQRMAADLVNDPYSGRYSRRPVLSVHPCHELINAELDMDVNPVDSSGLQPVKLLFRNTMTEAHLSSTHDIVMACTGYRHDSWKTLLGLQDFYTEDSSTHEHHSHQNLESKSQATTPAVSRPTSRRPSINQDQASKLMQDPRTCRDIGAVSLGTLFKLPPPKRLPEKFNAAASLYMQPPPPQQHGNTTGSAAPSGAHSTVSSPSSPQHPPSTIDKKLLARAQFSHLNSMTSAHDDSIRAGNVSSSDSDSDDDHPINHRHTDGFDDAPPFEVAEDFRINLPSTFQIPSSRQPEHKKKGRFCPTFWLQGSSEETHGITESLLSVIAVRAGQLVNSILQHGYFGDEQVSNLPSRRNSVAAGMSSLPGLVSRKGSIAGGLSSMNGLSPMAGMTSTPSIVSRQGSISSGLSALNKRKQ